ncbi:hypothetical protein ACOZB2_31145, partial [Pantoea endophytica]
AKNALDEGNSETLKQILHKMGGALQILKVERITREILSIEELIDVEEDTSVIRQFVNALEIEFKSFRTSFEAWRDVNIQ